jgi:hypothetical protein
MSIDDEMTIDERRKYLRKRQKQYAKADRVKKGKLLDEMEQVTGCSDPRKLDRYDSSNRICQKKGETGCQSDEHSHQSSRPGWFSKN